MKAIFTTAQVVLITANIASIFTSLFTVHIRLSPNFFSEGTVTNLAIWLVVSAVCIFLSGHGHGKLKRFRESPNTSLSLLPFFINISRFSGWAVSLSKDVGHYLKLINNLLFILFFSFSQITLVDRKILVSKWICISNSISKLVDKRPKKPSAINSILHKKYLES